MPTTINGIGEMYRGKEKLERYQGFCPGCGAVRQLESYETRLWFVVLFVPVIPMDRRQVVDYCPVCTHHRAMSVEEWQRLKSRAIAEDSAKAARNPDDPHAAMEMHASLVLFNMREEAARLGQLLDERFGDNTDVQIYLGRWHNSNGRVAEAELAFERALAADPADPVARRAVAISCTRNGDLARAHQLLAFMEQPGQFCDPEAMRFLGDAHQKRGEHEEALAVYATVQRLCPAQGHDARFRLNVRVSEKALGRRTSLLPPSRFKRMLKIAVPAALAAALVVLALASWYLAGHQSLHVVNGLQVRATVSIPGQDAVAVPSRGKRTITVPEGRYRATVSAKGLPEDQVEFQIRNGIIERLLGSRVFVLNVKGAAPVYREEVLYVPTGSSDSGAPPGPWAVHLCRLFSEFRGVDYAFEAKPLTISMEYPRTLRKICVGAILKPPEEVIDQLSAAVPAEELLRFAELHLGLDSAGPKLPGACLALAAGAGQVERCRALLEKGLDHRPVNVEWHRAFLTASRLVKRRDELPDLYDRMLAGEPQDPGLLYLRGQLCCRGTEAQAFYDRALAADGANPYALSATGYRLMSLGDFAAARPFCEKASRLGKGNAEMDGLFADLRFALGEHAALRAELTRRLKESPLDGGLYGRLVKSCVAAGDSAAAEAAQTAYAEAARRAYDSDPKAADALVLWSRLELLSARGQAGEVLGEFSGMGGPGQRRLLDFHANLNLGRPVRCGDLFPGEPGQEARQTLLMSSAWRRAGNSAKAAVWRDRAIKFLSAGDVGDRAVAELLAAGDGVDLSAVDDLVLDLRLKAIVLVALAEGAPAKRAQLLDRARRLNFDLDLPHYFLKAVCEELAGRSESK